MKMKPSNFTSFPWNSVFQNTETETVALNIMIVLKRTGDTWRGLTWGEYKREREKDGNFSDREHAWFDRVIEYCQSEATVRLVCRDWKEV